MKEAFRKLSQFLNIIALYKSTLLAISFLYHLIFVFCRKKQVTFYKKQDAFCYPII